MIRFFVGNIPWTVGKHELRNYFSQFGHVKWTTVPFDKGTGFSKGYGFVLFEDKAVKSVISNSNHVLEGKRFDGGPMGW